MTVAARNCASSSCSSIRQPMRPVNTPSMDQFAEGLVLEKKDMLWFWDHYCADRALRESDVRASPLRVADAAGSAAGLSSCSQRWIRSSMRDCAYAERLKDCRCPGHLPSRSREPSTRSSVSGRSSSWPIANSRSPPRHSAAALQSRPRPEGSNRDACRQTFSYFSLSVARAKNRYWSIFGFDF